MRSSSYFFLLTLFTFALLSNTVSAGFTPAWIENNVRHLSYGMIMWIIPGISKFWISSFMAFAYLNMMGGFGKQEKVVEFFTELTQLYMPMSGVLYE